MTSLRLVLAILGCGVAWGAAPAYLVTDIVSSGNYAPGPFAPNSLISIFGSNLAIGTHEVGKADIVNNVLPNELNSTRVFIDSFAVPLFFVSEKQINLLIPAKQALGKAEIQVIREGQKGPLLVIDIAAAAPALFVMDGGYAIATHADNSLITADQPAHAGEVIVIYAAGLGKTETTPANGELVPYLSELLNRATAFRLTLGGTAVDPSRFYYAGLTPASAGLYQVNVRLPDAVPTDPELRLFVGDAGSPAGVKVLVR